MRELSLWLRAHPMAGDTVLAILTGFCNLTVAIIAAAMIDAPTLPLWAWPC